MAETTASPFTGFPPDAFEFLRELKARQDRDWFNANKDTYEHAVRGPMIALVGSLYEALAKAGLPFRGDPKRSVFRLHRDVRFSKDKRPYKTHVGATLTRDGAKISPGLVYIHVEPEGSFAAAGFDQPEPEALGFMRRRIVEKPRLYRDMLAALHEGGLALSPDEDALKRLPRGFEEVSEPDLMDAVKRKSFIVRLPLDPDAVARPDLVEQIAGFAVSAAPLLTFGWDAIG